MTAGSDLDLIIVYDYEGEGAQSDGAKSLPGPQYYTRFTQRLIAALSAETAEGSLYQVDMRLRPSGNQGPVATKLSSFVAYQQGSAWTWEHLALTRARVVTGPPRSGGRSTTRSGRCCRARATAPPSPTDVRAMRAKIADDKGSADIWDLKQVRGGLIDLEFIAQFLADRERGGASGGARPEYRAGAHQALGGRRAVARRCRDPGAGGAALSHADPGVEALPRQAVRGGRGPARAEGPAGARLRHAGLRHARSDAEGHASAPCTRPSTASSGNGTTRLRRRRRASALRRRSPAAREACR